MVALAKALSEYFELKLSERAIFELSYQAVLDVQGVGSGFDVAASVYGGTLYYVTPGTVIENIYIGDLPMVVGYTGVKADTPTLIRQVAELKRNEGWVESVFADITKLVNRAKSLFEKNDFAQLGKPEQESETTGDVERFSVELDRLIKVSMDTERTGLSGAGGGDCMVTFMIKQKERRERINGWGT